jgi:hypothetical protein
MRSVSQLIVGGQAVANFGAFFAAVKLRRFAEGHRPT